ncbi:hypothetical protein FHL15_006983 [Xylaria flabelliformis]|uniref:gamma-glutamylcyclotransferase n=1 Tax=Xylaria flabelliformis TaxID=2512241 RepID=A0A553HVY2_9PEZI|nr:hypothetical protein FHL15_006983 [Xylaria flabelliformis]
MYGQFHAPVPSTRLYFAYGNNLWLEHMANRCPESVYVGRAVLPDHCWYIDRKGVANIASHTGSTVHGLVFEITANDEIRLDRSERIKHGSYTKEYKRVNLYETPEPMQMFTRQMVKDGGPKQIIKRFGYSIRTIEKYGHADVLVYFSQSFVLNGQACDHFVGQMNRGIRDAISLGVPQAYFKNVVRKWIPRRENLHNPERLNQRSLVNYQAPILSARRPTRITGGRRFTKDLGNETDYQTPHLIIEVCRY